MSATTLPIDLNPAQLRAVTHGGGPLLIVAGAGTGKTKTLVTRVAHLIGSGVSPSRILLLTFTRRAADEMLSRVSKLTGVTSCSQVWGGTSDLAQPPFLEEDYLILSTIHSAKGCEWDVVHIIHAADGMMPSDMAVSDEAGIVEERRLFYVAMTRAKDMLNVYFPLRYYHQRFGFGDAHNLAQLTRFLPPPARALLSEQNVCTPNNEDEEVVSKLGRNPSARLTSLFLGYAHIPPQLRDIFPFRIRDRSPSCCPPNYTRKPGTIRDGGAIDGEALV